MLTDLESVLDHIIGSCGAPNWDSYDADPVTILGVEVARELLRSIQVSPTVEGGVSVSMASEALIVEVGADGSLVNVSLDTEDLTDRLRTWVGITNKRLETGRAGVTNTTGGPNGLQRET